MDGPYAQEISIFAKKEEDKFVGHGASSACRAKSLTPHFFCVFSYDFPRVLERFHLYPCFANGIQSPPNFFLSKSAKRAGFPGFFDPCFWRIFLRLPEGNRAISFVPSIFVGKFTINIFLICLLFGLFVALPRQDSLILVHGTHSPFL